LLSIFARSRREAIDLVADITETDTAVGLGSWSTAPPAEGIIDVMIAALRDQP
jgi:hypothetical protein